MLSNQCYQEFLPALVGDQFEVISRLCWDLSFSLSTGYLCDYTEYDRDNNRCRVMWYQSHMSIALYDRLFGKSHLFPRDTFWKIPYPDLVHAMDEVNTAHFQEVSELGVGPFTVEYEVVKRAFAVQCLWLVLQGYGLQLSVELTDIDCVLPTFGGPCPGHPSLDALRLSFVHTSERVRFPYAPSSESPSLALSLLWLNIRCIRLTSCCLSYGSFTARIFDPFFRRFRGSVQGNWVLLEDLSMPVQLVHVIPSIFFFDPTFDLVRAINRCGFLFTRGPSLPPRRCWRGIRSQPFLPRSSFHGGRFLHRSYFFADFTIPLSPFRALPPTVRSSVMYAVDFLNNRNHLVNAAFAPVSVRFVPTYDGQTLSVLDLIDGTVLSLTDEDWILPTLDLFSKLCDEFNLPALVSKSPSLADSDSENGSIMHDSSTSSLSKFLTSLTHISLA
jgi:hypothetical protein